MAKLLTGIVKKIVLNYNDCFVETNGLILSAASVALCSLDAHNDDLLLNNIVLVLGL